MRYPNCGVRLEQSGSRDAFEKLYLRIAAQASLIAPISQPTSLIPSSCRRLQNIGARPSFLGRAAQLRPLAKTKKVKRPKIEVAHEAVRRDHKLVDAAELQSLAAMQKIRPSDRRVQRTTKVAGNSAPDFFTQWVESMTTKGQGGAARKCVVELWRKRRAGLK